MNPCSPLFVPPPGYFRIKLAGSFDELVGTPFADGVNALCWQRALAGDFSEIVERAGSAEGIATLDDARLRELPLSADGRAAAEVVLQDLQLLRSCGLAPVLDCISAYPRDDDAILPTDVYSFHADSATAEADTYLCTYSGAASEGLRNDEARRFVDIPETRAALLKLFGGEEGDAFDEFLRENCYDLHYSAIPCAQPFCFGLGNLWRIAVQCPGSLVPPCIHRAPANLPGRPPRLLLIS